MIILKNIRIQELIHLRGVNSRWQAAIVTICATEQSLILEHRGNNICIKNLIENSWLKMMNFKLLKLEKIISYNQIVQTSSPKIADLLDMMQKLFPQPKNVFIAIRFDRTFTWNLLATLLSQWKTHLTTLVFAVSITKSETTNLCALLSLMVNLKQFYFFSYPNYRFDSAVFDWLPRGNPRFLGQLTHFGYMAHHGVLDLLAEHASPLQVLHYEYWSHDDVSLLDLK